MYLSPTANFTVVAASSHTNITCVKTAINVIKPIHCEIGTVKQLIAWQTYKPVAHLGKLLAPLYLCHQAV